MTTELVPTVYGVADDAAPRVGMQGQTFVPLVHAGNAPGTSLCQLLITMATGRVSAPHVHDEVHVYVHLVRCGPQGVLTLYGDALESGAWLFTGQTLWIPPGVPHVAVYPRYQTPTAVDDADVPPALALETRTTPSVTADVRPLPELWDVLLDRLTERQLLDHVDAPAGVDRP